MNWIKRTFFNQWTINFTVKPDKQGWVNITINSKGDIIINPKEVSVAEFAKFDKVLTIKELNEIFKSQTRTGEDRQRFEG